MPASAPMQYPVMGVVESAPVTPSPVADPLPGVAAEQPPAPDKVD